MKLLVTKSESLICCGAFYNRNRNLILVKLMGDFPLFAMDFGWGPILVGSIKNSGVYGPASQVL